jgi:hypothetical protein
MHEPDDPCGAIDHGRARVAGLAADAGEERIGQPGQRLAAAAAVDASILWARPLGVALEVHHRADDGRPPEDGERLGGRRALEQQDRLVGRGVGGLESRIQHRTAARAHVERGTAVDAVERGRHQIRTRREDAAAFSRQHQHARRGQRVPHGGRHGGWIRVGGRGARAEDECRRDRRAASHVVDPWSQRTTPGAVRRRNSAFRRKRSRAWRTARAASGRGCARKNSRTSRA